MTGKISQLHPLTPKDVTPRQVVSYEISTLFGLPTLERYNPDLLASRKGLRIYAQMMEDEQVKAVVTFRLASIIARGYEFKFDADTQLSEDEQARRIRLFQRNLRAMRGSFSDALLTVLRGHVFGFSLTEKVYDNFKFDGRPANGIVQLLAREPAWFRFFTDKYGTLVRCEQWISNEKIEVELAKFIHYVRAPAEDRYYGQSDLRAAYRPWYIKDVVLKLYGTYLERFAGGFAYAELPDDSMLGTGNPEYVKLQDALSDMRNLASLILPPGVKLNVFQPSNSGEYREALTYLDLAIAKSVLVPNLLGLSHTGQTGAFSQSQTQLEAYFMTTAADGTRLEDTLNEQLFKDLGDLNFGDGEYPQFRFKPASVEHVKWIVKQWQELVAGGSVMTTEADENHLRELLDMPARTEADSLLKEEQMELDEQRMEAEARLAPKPAAQSFTLEQLDTRLNQRDAVMFARIDSQAAQLAYDLRSAVHFHQADHDERSSASDRTGAAAARFQHAHLRSVDPVTFARAAARVDFAVIEHRHELLSTDAAEQLARTAARAVRRLLTPERVTELLDQDVKDIGELKFDSADVGRLKSGFKEALGRAWAAGQESAQRELTKARHPVPATFATLRDNAADFFEANGFRMAANLSDGMRAIVQQELLAAVKQGIRPEHVIGRIYDRLIRKGFLTLTAVEREESRGEVLTHLQSLLEGALDVANVPAYLNTLVRTNTFEALNEARYAAYTDPALGGFVVALEYSAILDDRTTEICRELDGGIWSMGSEVLDKYRPPNHYNCRSLWIPITVTDQWDGVESPAPTVEPQEGFK